MFDESKTFIICELSQTHEGSLPLAKILTKAAAVAGADAVKAQVFNADELAVPTYKHYKLFKQLEWTESQWKELIDYSHELGIKFYADVFGTDSIDMLIRNGIDGIKVHGTDMRNTKLLRHLTNINLPLLLSIGGGIIAETKKALTLLNSSNRQSPIVLMHGIQSYPTLIEHTNLNKMRYFKEQLGMPIGFADHIDGNHHLSFSLCAMAAGMGAVAIEKHITIARELKMEDYESALSPDSFAEFVRYMRQIDRAKGKYNDELNEVEKEYRTSTRKHVVASVVLKAGQIIREEYVTLRRTESKDTPSDLANVCGKKADKDYEINEVIISERLL
jgi:sialic acid synthase SpsE